MNPFALYTPSVFVVSSPFQVLCTVVAIRQLHIKNYRVIAVFPKGEYRNTQLNNILQKYNIQYEKIVPVAKFSNLYYKIKSFFCKKSLYKRLFIGDYRNLFLHYIGFCFVSNTSEIVYLDDGAATIAQLNSNHMDVSLRERLYCKLISKKKKISLFKNILTIYENIHNSQYNIQYLNMSVLISSCQKQNNDIYIIGTNVQSYYLSKYLSENRYIGALEDLIICLKKRYVNSHIVYIPHGRDKSEYASIICQKYGCEFKRTNNIVELELLNQKSIPKAVYGFTSSALYNIKKISPETEVVNVLYVSPVFIEKPSYKSYLEISKYYESNGILLEKIEI